MAKMLKTKDAINNADLPCNNKTKKLVGHKIWPFLPRIEDQGKWTKNAYCLEQMINRPHRPSRPFPHEKNIFHDFQATDDDHNRESFHCAMGWILAMAQCFGILPLDGVCSDSPKKLVFKKFSPRTAYAAVVMVTFSIMPLISILHIIKTLKADTSNDGENISNTASNAFFYANSLLGAILFMRLAPRWALLQLDWRVMERFLDRDKHQSPRLRWKFSILANVVIIFSLFEHVMSIVCRTSLTLQSSASVSTFRDFVQSYAYESHRFVFSFCNYNLGIGIFLICINTVGSFMWNFVDLFVILIATGLAERYKSLNQKLMVVNISTYHRNIDWHKIRESYAILSTLVKTVDNNISPIILLSFANNIYFICLELFMGISPGKKNVLSTIYFFSSFAFLVGRTVAVILLSARINDQSRLALPALYSCPGSAYDIDTQRLQHQLASDEVYLTGMRFFSVTRNFMLAIAGAIVTYEVILLQFNTSVDR